jgi:hypothetical protein
LFIATPSNTIRQKRKQTSKKIDIREVGHQIEGKERVLSHSQKVVNQICKEQCHQESNKRFS